MNFACNNQIFNNFASLPKINFRAAIGTTTPVYEGQGNYHTDSFSSNPQYDNFEVARENPRIKEILKDYGLKFEVNMEELNKLQKGHLKDTRILVAQMYSALPPDLKAKVNLVDLQEAAMLHDYGKVLIPDKILNKRDILTDKEKETIQQHAELGYELLKSQGVRPSVLKLIKYHHQKPDGSGYPEIGDDYEYGIASQALEIADEYSALREERSYKPAMNKEEALKELEKDMSNGKIAPVALDLLKKVV